MACTEAYKEHIVYSFNAFCKVVIRYAAINAWRDRNRRRQKENLPRPGLLAGTAFQDTGIIHVPFLLSEILAADRSQDDIRIDHFLVHLCP